MTRRASPTSTRPSRSRGFSLMELMMSLALGLIVMLGLVTSFVSATKARKSVQQEAEQVENGRVALEILYNDAKLAGFYNSYYLLPTVVGVPTVPASLPDPCALPSTINTANLNVGTDNLKDPMALHVQTYAAASATSKVDMSGTACAAWMPAANMVAGSDVLVVRRASTYKIPFVTTGASEVRANYPYLQTGAFASEIQKGVSGITNMTDLKADGSVVATTLQIRDAVGAKVAGEIYRYMTNIYFVAPCSTGSGTNGVCASGDDAIPTLKRLELGVNAAGNNVGFQIFPMVEGIQAVAFDSGIDNSPTVANATTGLIGDGQPDSFARSGLSILDRANTAALNIFVLARNIGQQKDFTDQKTYQMSESVLTGATYALGPFNDNYRRHVYTARATIENISQRRENP